MLKFIFVFGIFISFQINDLVAFTPTIKMPELFSMRQSYMGLAYTAVANDEMLLNTNPAGLGVKRKLFQVFDDDSVIYFIPFQIELSPSIVNAFFGISGDNSSSSFGVNPLLEFSYLNTDWGISLITKGIFNLSTSDQTALISQSSIITTLNSGFNFDFSLLGEENLHLAIGLKLLFLMQVNSTIEPTVIINKISQYLTTYFLSITPPEVDKSLSDIVGRDLNPFDGFGIGMDLGALWELPLNKKGHQINIGAAVLDAPTYGITTSLSSVYIDRIYRQICNELNDNIPTAPNGTTPQLNCNEKSKGENTFFKVNPKLGLAYLAPDLMKKYFTDWIVAFDIHHFTDSNYQAIDMIHLGTSINIFEFNSVRKNGNIGDNQRLNIGFGMNQGFFTAGLLYHLEYFLIGYSYFVEKYIGFDNLSSARHIFKIAFYW